MLIRVVGNRPVDETAAVQALLGVRREADPQRCATQVAHQAADTGKKFAVNRRVKRQGAQGSAHAPDVTQQAHACAVIQRMQVLRLSQPQHLGDFLVFFELQHMHYGAGVTLAQCRKQGAGQHHTPHF